MAYPQKVFNEARLKLADIKSTNVRLLEDRKLEIYRKIPRIEEIRLEMAKLFADCAVNLFAKGRGINVSSVTKKATELENGMITLLSNNGYPIDYLSLPCSCSKCRDSGYVGQTRCECFEKLLKEAAFRNSNIKNISDSFSFDRFDFSYYSDIKDLDRGISPLENIRHIYKTCVDYVKNFQSTKENLYLFGDTGLGKTYISGCIALDLTNKGYCVFYQTAQRICEVLEAEKFSKSEDIESVRAVIELIRQTDLLIIDDLGAEFQTAFSASALFDIVNQRLLDGLKTIINTNLSHKEFNHLYSPRFTSRILGNYTQLEFFGEDIRIKKLYSE